VDSLKLYTKKEPLGRLAKTEEGPREERERKGAVVLGKAVAVWEVVTGPSSVAFHEGAVDIV
jgi:hypothetical protein